MENKKQNVFGEPLNIRISSNQTNVGGNKFSESEKNKNKMAARSISLQK